MTRVEKRRVSIVSTIEQQSPGVDQHVEPDMAAAVDAQMGKIMTELGSAWGCCLTSLGTRSGLWAALAGAGPLTTDEVAAQGAGRPGAGP